MLGHSLYYSSESFMLYIVLVLPAFIFSIIAQIMVKSAFSSQSKIYSRSGYSGAQAAQEVLRYYGINNVQINMCSGSLTDHFDPRTNTISLSESVYNSTSVAAIGVACHEAGHAAQYAQNYIPIKIRNSIIPVCKIGSYAGIPLAILGYFLSFEPLVLVGLGLYSFIMIFQLATLPVEFNASRRAIKVIEETRLLPNNEELNGARRVLTAAAMTYVAALAVALGNLLRFIIMFTNRRDRR
jgi:uncharacterized protein